MSRATYRFRSFVVRPDAEPDVEPVAYAMQCAVCGEFGPEEADATTASGWALVHLRGFPEHFTYRHVLRLPYRMVPGEWL
ncbi:hypothetical protein GCM10023347_38590 [Streptomyces chumphonensis]|uniref:DUF7848 domain-containing protein n=1 Tax=Streptomyces chumphonensis TaxID=1214925 RepID=A0A927EW14_9ACTN|nr:hypothetical protein [Streptomyces chumphonensis]MBD3930618.1 hypothetical protein [Streptomyces chumphonensis]